jgi:SAM-dependent methyltransferase
VTTYPKSDYDHYPRTLAPDDFLGQVRRTVKGRPVDDEQIELIVAALRHGLDLQAKDVVLDIACGNGAISRYLYGQCQALVGVDRSEYLISVALANFEVPSRYTYLHADAASYIENEPDPTRFTKALCCASFQFFAPDDVARTLGGLARRFTSLERFYISNIPDHERAHHFYEGAFDAGALADHTAPIGRWRTRAEMAELAESYGWKATFHEMPEAYYQHHYRFDALLERI